MQTQFTQEQLADKDIKRADDILRQCVHCGFCLATCPSYMVTGDERDSPRGRIWLIRDLLENPQADAASVTQHHLDRCLTCLSCMTTCPSGVDYQHLVEIGRRHADKHHQRPIWDRLFRQTLIWLFSRASRAFLILWFGWLLRFFVGPFLKLLPKIIASILTPLPSVMPRYDRLGQRDAVFPPISIPAKLKVGLLGTCVQRGMAPDINARTVSILNRLGIEVVMREKSACCGGLALHSGCPSSAQPLMQSTIEAWPDVMDLDAIISNASGCGSVVKDYEAHFDTDMAWAGRAAELANKTEDITEFLSRFDLNTADKSKTAGIKIAYQYACSLQHGQRCKSSPQVLLKSVGFEVIDLAESHLCCGSAGLYNILEPSLASSLRERKLALIANSGAHCVVSGNLGCINQLSDGGLPILHIVEVLDWAMGGEVPPQLKHLA